MAVVFELVAARSPAAAGLASAWIEVAPGGRYFASEDGTPFVPIGNQVASHFLDFSTPVGWEDFLRMHLSRMAEYGENVLRLDADYAPNWTQPPFEYTGIESAPGQFDNTEHIAKLDRVFELAEEYGIRILLVPWITSPPMADTWGANPYSAFGACPNEFLKSPAATAAYVERLKWISDRWGRSGAFFAWDLMNEADVLFCGLRGACGPYEDRCTHTDDAQALAAWIAATGDGISAFESSTLGRAHPRMVSWPGLLPDPGEYPFLTNSPALDVAVGHLYGSHYGSSMWACGYPLSANCNLGVVAAAVEVNRVVRQAVSLVSDRRPYLENERSYNDHTMFSFHREAEHMVAWAELMSGAAGAGITWLHPAIGNGDAVGQRHENLGPLRRALADFVKRVPQEFFISGEDFSYDPLSLALENRGAVRIMSIRRGRHALGWIFDTDDSCTRAEGVDEVRSRYLQTGAITPVEPLEEAGLAMLLWRSLLLDAQVPFDDSVFSGFLLALQGDSGDPAARGAVTRALWTAVAPYLESHAELVAALAAAHQCAAHTVPIRADMPAGAYEVDWIDDATGAVLRAGEPLPEGAGTLTSPTFQRHVALIVGPAATSPSPPPSPTATPHVTDCTGDCNADGVVWVNELVTMVGIALGLHPVAACASGDANRDGRVTVDEAISAVSRAIAGCEGVQTPAR